MHLGYFSESFAQPILLIKFKLRNLPTLIKTIIITVVTNRIAVSVSTTRISANVFCCVTNTTFLHYDIAFHEFLKYVSENQIPNYFLILKFGWVIPFPITCVTHMQKNIHGNLQIIKNTIKIQGNIKWITEKTTWVCIRYKLRLTSFVEATDLQMICPNACKVDGKETGVGIFLIEWVDEVEFFEFLWLIHNFQKYLELLTSFLKYIQHIWSIL